MTVSVTCPHCRSTLYLIPPGGWCEVRLPGAARPR